MIKIKMFTKQNSTTL